MLFNSYEFVLLFLPIVLTGFFLICRYGSRETAIVWLVAGSLFYYGWWNPSYLFLIIFSMLFNFAVGSRLSNRRNEVPRDGQVLLFLGVACNLGLLGYFKYANFFIDNINAAFGLSVSLGTIILPLAISFFTFQQIAYLVDAYRGETKEYSFWHYALFVTFFPQLIAGPIVHHAEMMPQFMRNDTLRPHLRNIAVGITIFSIGLFKKVVLADSVAAYATPVFNDAYNGEVLTFFEAWGGALAYTMQLYFDFSGYSDMAIGAARLFGIRLPLNFYSPYKSASIIEFWRRWHMTLSRFLRDYVYIALGGNRKGSARRYGNLVTTMLLGGLWHGAGWTFIIWGALHGFYLVINHGWHWLLRAARIEHHFRGPVWKATAWLLTFVAVVVGWVFFRAEGFDAAFAVLQGMAGINGVAIPNSILVQLGPSAQAALNMLGVSPYLGGGTQFVGTYGWVATLLLIALIFPNTNQIMQQFEPTADHYSSDPRHSVQLASRLMSRIVWRPSTAWAIPTALLTAAGFLAMTSVSEFLYFQF